jgi:protein O-mannosyl-transferase
VTTADTRPISWPSTGVLPLLLLLAFVSTLYWQGLHGELILDDIPNLKPFEDLHGGRIDWKDVVFNNDSGPFGRPLSMLSLVADYYVGGGSVFQFKLTNLLIHLLTGVLLYVLASLLYQTSECSKITRQRSALFVAAIWLTAPLLVSTVLYVIQRMAQLSTVFSLVGLISYAYGRLQIDKRRQKGISCILAAYFLAWPAAILSKENGVVLPALLFLTEAYWFGFRGSPGVALFLRRLHVCILAIPLAAVLIWLCAHFGQLQAGYAGRNFTMSERVLTESRILWDYLRQLMVPNGLGMGVTHDDYLISRGLFSPVTTAIAVAAWVLIFAAVIVWRRNTIIRPLAYGLGFFVIGHLLEGSIYPLELYFEHRNYLPAAGLYLGIVHSAVCASHRVPRLRKMSLLCLVFPVLTSFVSYQRIVVWQSAEAIALMADHSHSRSSRLQTALISLYMRNRDLPKAKEHVALLAEIDGKRTAAHAMHELQIYCYLKHGPSPAEYDAISSTSILPASVYAHERLVALADMLVSDQCGSVDFNRLKVWLTSLAAQVSHGRDWLGLLHMARILFATGDLPGAMSLLDLADSLDQSRLEPGLVKIQLLILQGDYRAARETLKSLEGPARRPVKYQIEMIETLKEALAKEPD